MSLPILLVIIIRIAGYVYTLFAPLPGLLLSFAFDFLDGGVFYFTGASVAYYEYIDKPLDLLQYFFLIPVARKTPVFKTFLSLLAFRLVGQLLFLATGLRGFLIFFPNFVEYSLFVYFVFEFFKTKPITNVFIGFFHSVKWNDLRLWGVLLVLKIIQEVGLHGPTADSRTFWMWEQIEKLFI
jgi:hypothetical protein